MSLGCVTSNVHLVSSELAKQDLQFLKQLKIWFNELNA